MTPEKTLSRRAALGGAVAVAAGLAGFAGRGHAAEAPSASAQLGAGRSVTDIALELGYASTSAFTYMFRQEMGCSPTEYRGR